MRGGQSVGFLFLFWIAFSFKGIGQSTTDSLLTLVWQEPVSGIEHAEVTALVPSILGDSKLTLVRLDPQKLEFELLCATEHRKTPRTAPEWAEEFKLDLVFNAGMYNLSQPLKSKGFLRNGRHVNQKEVHPEYGGVFAFQPLDSLAARANLLDLSCTSLDSVKLRYRCLAQGMRMLDCNGNPISWDRKKQSCSMMLLARCGDGKLVLVFSRSPYTHSQMIGFLKRFPLDLREALYLEGGPETSLYLKLPGLTMEKYGSYVSDTYETDKNDHFWKLPNVVGVRVKR
jgi:hypothetical protein